MATTKLPSNLLKVATLTCILLTAGCTVFVRTEPVSHTMAKPVPQDRLLAYQEKKKNYSTIIVTRDAGFMGSGCYIGLVISGTLAARFNPEETAEFYAPQSASDMAVVPDPQGQGLCAIGWEPVPENYTLKTTSPNLFRISLGAYRRPRLIPNIY